MIRTSLGHMESRWSGRRTRRTGLRTGSGFRAQVRSRLFRACAVDKQDVEPSALELCLPAGQVPTCSAAIWRGNCHDFGRDSRIQ
jgi:hypothetical protein